MYLFLLIIKATAITIEIINSDCKSHDFRSVVHPSAIIFKYIFHATGYRHEITMLILHKSNR